jgi:hypothetical protein
VWSPFFKSISIGLRAKSNHTATDNEEQGIGIRPVLSFQAYISKRVPPDSAVTSDLRVCVTGLLAECVVVSSNGHCKTLKSEVTFSERNRYGPEKRAPDRIVSQFSKI